VALRKGVGLVLGLILVAVLISAAGMALIYLAARGGPQIKDNATLYLPIDPDLSEIEPGGVVSQFIGQEPTLRSLIDGLRKAAVDSRIKSVVILPRGGGALWGKVQEVREAILEFRRSGKPIIAYLEYGAEQEYYLASACDKVYLMPASTLDLRGLATYELFLRGALDKVGAYPDLMHIGDYKTAANTFTEKGFTPAHREMAESLNQDLYAQLLRGIADGRRKSEAEVRAMLDHGPYLARDAVAAGLVDDVAYEDELDDKADLGGARQRVDGDKYREVSTGSLGLDKGQKIAVLYLVGVIASGESSYDSPNGAVTGSDTVLAWLRRVRADKSIRAIVLRIDSPGGSAVASDVIWREVMLTRAAKPVVASMGDVAASGGYYVAMPAHAIVAQPGTLTGSIGVVVGKLPSAAPWRSWASPSTASSQGSTPACSRRCARFRPKSGPASWSRCRPRTTRSSRRWPTRGRPRPRKSTPSRRAASGPAGRRATSASSTISAACGRRLPWRSSARKSIRPGTSSSRSIRRGAACTSWWRTRSAAPRSHARPARWARCSPTRARRRSSRWRHGSICFARASR
jgi:protease IV